jgi:hypothetical protein
VHSREPDTQHTAPIDGAVIGFYVSSTVMGVAAAAATVCLIVFGDRPGSGLIATIAIAALLLSTVASWWFLRRSRRQA